MYEFSQSKRVQDRNLNVLIITLIAIQLIYFFRIQRIPNAFRCLSKLMQRIWTNNSNRTLQFSREHDY